MDMPANENHVTREEIKGLKESLIGIITSNDQRYAQRFEDAKMAVDIAFNAQKESVNSALLAAERAVLKAETSSEKRFDSVNEFRNTLADQQRNLMPRAEAEIVFKSLTVRIEELVHNQKGREGEKTGRTDAVAWIIAAISFLTAVVSVVLKLK